MAGRSLIYVFEQAGHEALVTLAYNESPGAGGGGIFPAAALDTAEAAWDLWIKPIQTTNCVLKEIRSAAPFDLVTRTVGSAGTISGDPMPPNVAAVMTKNTAAGAPNGRAYWPGTREDDWDASGRLEPARFTAIGTAFTNWFNTLADGVGGTKAIVELQQWTNRGTPRYVDVVGVGVRSVIGTQRRRLDA